MSEAAITSEGETSSHRDEQNRVKPRPFGSIVFLIASFPLRLAQSVLLIILFFTGTGLLILWIGIPLLMAATWTTLWFGDIERGWVRKTLRVTIEPRKPLPADKNLLARWRNQLVDAATWRTLGYLFLSLPLGILEFGFGIASIILLPLAIWVSPWLGWLHGELARALLGPNRTQSLENKTRQLQASRARGIDTAESERRRIERDLHDGAQQRLVSVALTLGRAKSKLDGDPDGARSLVNEAHADAKLAVSELRDLARGIYPAVLGDRGLDAALSAQAAKSPVPVTVEVAVDPRPPAAVETAAYFIVGETLTNMAKYAEATQASVRVSRVREKVIVEVTDNGKGGAFIRPGGGLAGLADRAATLDGIITVESPQGGPTTVRAELPCQW
jgi:signal transduction histidine kinase